jgi:hypothetical protein
VRHDVRLDQIEYVIQSHRCDLGGLRILATEQSDPVVRRDIAALAVQPPQRR